MAMRKEIAMKVAITNAVMIAALMYAIRSSG